MWLWDAATGVRLGTVPSLPHDGTAGGPTPVLSKVTSLAFSSDGTLLASGHEGSDVLHVWKMFKGPAAA